MAFTLRPCVPAADFPRVTELYRTFDPEMNLARSLEWDRTFPADGTRLMLCAADESGRVVGYGEAARVPWMKEGKFNIEIVTDPAVRGRGLGTLLYGRAEAFAREHGAVQFDADVRDHMADCLAWAEHRGFRVDRHLFESILHPAGLAADQFAGVVDRVRAGGIRFFTLADEPGEATERQLYELEKRTRSDVPGWDGGGYRPFEQWQKRVHGPGASPAWIILAADGDRVVGATRMIVNTDTGSMYTSCTAVDAAYRGRQLALAVKLLAVAAAREVGAPYMRTNNDAQNAPMLAVNRKLGYVPEPGVYLLLKDL